MAGKTNQGQGGPGGQQNRGGQGSQGGQGQGGQGQGGQRGGQSSQGGQGSQSGQQRGQESQPRATQSQSSQGGASGQGGPAPLVNLKQLIPLTRPQMDNSARAVHFAAREPIAAADLTAPQPEPNVPFPFPAGTLHATKCNKRIGQFLPELEFCFPEFQT